MMKKRVSDLSEREVQKLIADYPWLLNIDYEKIPELKEKGMEYLLSDNKRADLILRDRKSGRPVLVEFKAVEFSRENIGQILEYRARLISEYSDEASVLSGIFGKKLYAPIMVLVVPSCTAESRLACNLSGIEIYEYEKAVPEIMVPEKRKYLDGFMTEFRDDDIPFDEERYEKVDEVYKSIREVLEEEGCISGWKNYMKPRGEYYDAYNHLFINKCLFESNEIVIGIYENVFDDFSKVNIEFCSASYELLCKFRDYYNHLKLEPVPEYEVYEDDVFTQSFWCFAIDKKKFLRDLKNTVRLFIKNYIKIMRMLELLD